MILLLLFVFQIVLLFFLSKKTTNEIFNFFRTLHIEEKTIFIIVSLLFLPGTILHELAHYFAAVILFMKVRDVKIFPEFEENEIKLGRVLYEKKDFVRGILVGIAPIFAGLFFFWVMAYFKLFPHKNIFLSIFFLYLIFAVSSTMFSSKQDLIDIIYLLPLVIVITGIIYIFNIRIDLLFKNQTMSKNIFNFIENIDVYFFFSLIINLFIIALLKFLRKIAMKNGK